MIKRELSRFFLVGITAVALAYSIYYGLLLEGTHVNIANGIGYVGGTAFSFFANKSWTFLNNAPTSKLIGKFTLLHIGSLFANVSTNWTVLIFLGNAQYSIQVAFISGIVISTVINFIGMKIFVFSESLIQGRIRG